MVQFQRTYESQFIRTNATKRTTLQHDYDPEGFNPISKPKHGKAFPLRATELMNFVIIAVLYYYYHLNNNALVTTEKELSSSKLALANLKSSVHDIMSDIHDTHQQMNELKTDKSTPFSTDLDPNHDEERLLYEDVILSDTERKEITEDIIERHDKNQLAIDELKKTIQAFHLKQLVKKFGDGPYYVEFEIFCDGAKMFFTLQTAPNELMPHSLFTFMTMVQDKVWDNSLFMHKWTHIIQAIEDPLYNKHDLDKYQLAFPEYTDKFPHDQFSMGFSGYSSTPNFFLNTIDNVRNHGPGGQKIGAILNDADPCFGKIIFGKESLTKLINLSDDAMLKDEIHYSRINNVRRVFPREELLKGIGA